MLSGKQKRYLRGLASCDKTIFQIGKDALSDNLIEQVDHAIEARELVKISVLKNCLDDPREIASMLSERTHSEVVQVIGRKIVLYKESKERKRIELP